MTIDAISDALPDYAKDLKLNLSSLLPTPCSTEQQRWGALLATSLAARNATLIASVGRSGAAPLARGADRAKAAASIMAMNNIYYRFTHLASAPTTPPCRRGCA